MHSSASSQTSISSNGRYLRLIGREMENCRRRASEVAAAMIWIVAII